MDPARQGQPYRWAPPPNVPVDAAENPPQGALNANPALAQYPPANQGAQNYPPAAPIPYQASNYRPAAAPSVPYQPAPVSQMVIITSNVWMRTSQPAVCDTCHQQIMSLVNYNTCGSLLPWLTCVLTCCSGLWCGCCFVPFCMESCKTAEHFCPQCRRLLGKRYRH